MRVYICASVCVCVSVCMHSAAWQNLCIKMSEIAEHIFSITENKCLRDVLNQDQPRIWLTGSTCIYMHVALSVCVCVCLRSEKIASHWWASMNSIRIHLNTVRAYQKGEIKWQSRTERPVKVRQDKTNPWQLLMGKQPFALTNMPCGLAKEKAGRLWSLAHARILRWGISNQR